MYCRCRVRAQAAGLLFALAAAHAPIYAQPAPAQPVAGVANNARPLLLKEALKAALGNFEVRAAQEGVRAAEGDVLSADHAPVPILSSKASSMDLQNGIGGGSVLRDKRIDKSLGVDFTYERGDKRALRVQTARQGVLAASAELEEARAQQLIATASAFHDVAAWQERVDEVSALEKNAIQSAELSRQRARVGDLAEQDAMRSEIEARRAAAETSSARLELRRAWLSLALLMGLSRIDIDVPRVDPAWPTLVEPKQATERGKLVDTRPDVLAARARLGSADAGLGVARAQRKADVTWGFSWDHYPGTSARLLELRVQVPLQGFLGSYNFDGEVARAGAQRNQAELALLRTRQAAEADLLRMKFERDSAASRLNEYESGILPRARSVAANAELAFQKGGLSLSDLLDARRTLRATVLDAIAARADFAKADSVWRVRTGSAVGE